MRPRPLDVCRNCGNEFPWFVPPRCPLCGAPMLRLIVPDLIVPDPKPIRHLTEVRKGDT